MTQEGFVSVAEVTERLKVTPSTMSRRLARLGVERFVDPVDERRRLIRREDAETLLRPRRWSPKSEAPAHDGYAELARAIVGNQGE